MAFIEPMHRNKPNITYLLTFNTLQQIMALSISACYVFALSTSYTTQQSIFLQEHVFLSHFLVQLHWIIFRRDAGAADCSILWGFRRLDLCKDHLHSVRFSDMLAKLSPADIHVDCGAVQHLLWAAIFPVGYRRNWQLPSRWTSKHMWNSYQSQICHHICLWCPVHQLSLHPSGWHQPLKQLCRHL